MSYAHVYVAGPLSAADLAPDCSDGSMVRVAYQVIHSSSTRYTELPDAYIAFAA